MRRVWQLLAQSRRIVLLVAAVLLWQIIALFLIDPRFRAVLPPAERIASAFIGAFSSGMIFPHIRDSALRALEGWALAVAVGVPLGLLMGWSRLIEDIVDPLVEVLRPVPPIAWIPLSILWFGIGNTQKVYIIFLAAFFPVVINSIAAVKEIDREAIYGVLTLGGKQRDVLRDVVLPGALPIVFAGMRLAAGNSWMALVAAELAGAESGLGYMMVIAREYLNTEIVVTGMVAIGILGFTMDRLLRYVQRRLIPWRVA